MKIKKDAIGQEIKKSYARRGADMPCPIATQDIHVNLKNRNNAIKEYGYGPINPLEPSIAFWKAKADMWDTTPTEAKTSRCGNCAAFIQTSSMMECIASGIKSGDEEEEESYESQVVEAANLGFCELFHFKCAGDRTCDAWLVGGPIT
jgi:hypothetical protein